jgi:hypothetical protein
MIKTLSLIFLATILIVGCTFTTTTIKNPTFSASTDSIQADLNKLVTCENINLEGKEFTSNGKKSSELEIDITNGKDIPADENQMIELGKKIANVVKGALQDKNEFDSYKVLFVSKKESRGVTQRNWKGKSFKSQEL